MARTRRRRPTARRLDLHAAPDDAHVVEARRCGFGRVGYDGTATAVSMMEVAGFVPGAVERFDVNSARV
jgi:hypothetical protein